MSPILHDSDVEERGEARPFGFYDFPDTIVGLAQLLLHWNLIMGLFNLLPVFPMDGGKDPHDPAHPSASAAGRTSPC